MQRSFRLRSLLFLMVFTAFFSLLACATAPPGGNTNIDSLLTTAERSSFDETTRYADVIELMNAFDASSDRMHMTTFGYTYEGLALPMMVVGDVSDASREAVVNSGKTRVWIQGGIHSGEACGKEAMLMMLRDLALGKHAEWDDSLVLLIAPLYNADGNELVKVDNRGSQNGPVAGMGQRPNAQGYDLNRDHMKLDSPEARSLVQMMNNYDPHVAIDLHTTNGTRHAYHVTYSPPLHPNTYTQIDEMLRGDWLPTVTQQIKDKHGWDYYYYGNAGFGGGARGRGGRGGRRGVSGGGAGQAQGMQVWRTFDHRPRFNNNYVGLRNRFAILSEAYAYATFEDRVMASLWFVEEILNHAATNADAIREIVTAADQHSIIGEKLAVRASFLPSEEPVEILMGETEPVLNPYSGRTITQRLDAVNPVMMLEAGTAQPTETETAPAAYFIPVNEQAALTKLELHGMIMEPLGTEIMIQAEQFVIQSSTEAERPFQGHNERTLVGSWEPIEVTLPADTIVVLVGQPLGRLAFSLLEPRSDDGLTNWNVFDRSLAGANVFPVLRTSEEFRR